MKYLIYIMVVFSISSHAGEEKSLLDLIEENNLSTDGFIESSDINTDSLLSTDDITLENKAGDEGEYEIVVEAMDSALFEDEAKDSANKNTCNKSKKENIVCANLMCDFGLLMGTWSSECTDYKLKLAIAKATTPPWKSLPTCLMVDSSCNKSGKAKKSNIDEAFCNKMDDLSERHECLMALDMSNKKGATEYINRNGGNPDDLDGIDFIEADPEEIGSEFLVNTVDPRFNFKEDLIKNYTDKKKKCSFGGLKCKWRDIDTGIQPMAELNFYLEHRDDPAYFDQIEEKHNLLVSRGTLLEHCANVSFSEFFNCNFYPDLPQQCWKAPNNEAISKCVTDIEVVGNL